MFNEKILDENVNQSIDILKTSIAYRKIDNQFVDCNQTDLISDLQNKNHLFLMKHLIKNKRKQSI